MKEQAAVSPWDRQKDESHQAFAAFRAYLELGEVRSVRAVSRVLARDEAHLFRWSSLHRWVARAAAYDSELLRQSMAERTKSKAKRDAAADQRRTKLADRLWEYFLELDGRAVVMLKLDKDAPPEAKMTAKELQAVIRLMAQAASFGRAAVAPDPADTLPAAAGAAFAGEDPAFDEALRRAYGGPPAVESNGHANGHALPPPA